MKTKIKAVIVNLTLILFVTFSMQSQTLVSYNKADDVDFSTFKTFHILNLTVENIPEFEPKKEGLDLLVSAIKNEMTSRGYKEVSENQDLTFNIGINITKEVQTRETDFRTDGLTMYVGQRNYHWEVEEVVVRKYTEGTVTLDMVDTDNNNMIWQAVSKGTLEKKREKNKKRIVKAVKKLFKKFPVDIKD